MALSKLTNSCFPNCHPFCFLQDTQSMNDHSMFINSFEGFFTTLLVYVDDINIGRK